MKKLIALILALVMMFTLVACAADGGNAGTDNPADNAAGDNAPADNGAANDGAADDDTAPAKKYKIALSNNYVGNDWRQNMEKTITYVANSDKYKDIVDFTIVNCENSAEAQSASIDAMILEGYDAILIDAASGTGVNEAVQRAVDAGIVVVSFDQTITLDTVVRIGVDFPTQYGLAARHVIENGLKGEGKVILDHGMPGSDQAEAMYQEWLKICAEYPGIEVVGEFDSDFAEGSILTAVEAALVANPDIDAVFTGSYVNVVIDAFKEHGLELKGVTGHPFNNNLCAAYDAGVCSAFVDNPVSIACDAMQIAIDILEGKEYDTKEILIVDTNMFALNPTDAELADGWMKIEKDVNCFEELPDGFSMPTTSSRVGVDVPVSALTGK